MMQSIQFRTICIKKFLPPYSAAAAGGPKAYVPPGRRDGARVGESMNDRRRSKF